MSYPDGHPFSTDTYHGRSHQLKQLIGLAMRALRDAEDYARLEVINEPAAERLREVHEKLTRDVVHGSRARPTPQEQLERFRQSA